MPRNGDGTFNRVHNWQQDVANGLIYVRADRMDADANDIAEALTNSLAVDGQTVPTANLPMDGFKHTGAAAATGDDEYVTLGQTGSVIGADLVTTIDNTAPSNDKIPTEAAVVTYAEGNFIATDGGSTVTANLPMSGFKHTGVADAVAADEYVAFGQIGAAGFLETGNQVGQIPLNYAAPLAATDGGTDVFQFDAGGDIGDGDMLPLTIPAANTTVSPTLENTGGTPSGAQDIVTVDGVSYIGMLQPRAHRFEWDNGNTRWIVLDPGPIAGDLTVNIPTDFPTLQHAVDTLSVYPVKQGFTITLNIESGHNPASGIFVSNGDYARFVVTSTDATVTLDASFTGRFISAEFASAPVLDTYIDGAGVAERIYSLEGACTGQVEPGGGGENTTGRIFYIQSSFFQAPQSEWRNGGEFAYATSGSGLQLGSSVFENFTTSLATLQISRASRAEAAGITINNCDYGLHAKRAGSSINCHDATFSNISERVFFSERDGSITALNAACTDVGGILAEINFGGFVELTAASATATAGNASNGIRLRNGRLSMGGMATMSGFGGIGIVAEQASNVGADGITVTGSGGGGVTATEGSQVDLSDGEVSGSGSNDLVVNRGGYIIATGTTTTNGVGSPDLTDTNLNGGFNIDSANGNRGFIWT